MPRFNVCLPFVLAQEAPFPNNWSDPRNFSNDAHDPGGRTQMGITERSYAVYRRSRGLPAQDVRLITREEGEEIYDRSYWQPDCPMLPVGLDLCVFDANVNMGPVEGTRLLQRALGIPDDGLWGPQTDAAVNGIKNVPAVIAAYTSAREAAYRSFSGFQYFGNGWLRRATAIGVQAIKMAA